MKSPHPTRSAKPPSSSKQPKAQADQAPPVLTPQQKLDLARAKVDHWQTVASDPDLSAPASAFALNLARSAQAEVNLRQKALLAPVEDPNSDPYLAKLLGMGNPPPNQPTPSNGTTSDSSTGPETSGSTT